MVNYSGDTFWCFFKSACLLLHNYVAWHIEHFFVILFEISNASYCIIMLLDIVKGPNLIVNSTLNFINQLHNYMKHQNVSKLYFLQPKIKRQRLKSLDTFRGWVQWLTWKFGWIFTWLIDFLVATGDIKICITYKWVTWHYVCSLAAGF